eukprot:8199315-Prorocentrum_lima.AAC.1
MRHPRVATTSAGMRSMLERRHCPGNRVHQHMPTEGLVTSLTVSYPEHMVQAVAKIMLKGLDGRRPL